MRFHSKRGPFSTYEIRLRYYEVDIRRKGVLRNRRYCVRPEDYRIPLYDHVALFYLLIKNNPSHFHTEANVIY